jgi:hypothetical protein
MGGEYEEHFIDWTEANPEVDAGLKEKDGRRKSVRFSIGNTMVRMSADTVARAMFVAAKEGMKNSVLDSAAAETIIRYLTDNEQ